MHPVSRTLMLRFSALLVTALCATALSAYMPAEAAQSKKVTKPLEGPELPGPIARPGQQPQIDASETGQNETENTSNRRPDLAYGAYQRGYYLTALELALPRADAGDPAAQTLIAEIYWRGRGVAIDRKRAASWYKFAAEGGQREAQFAYGNILLRGKIVPEDKEKGRYYLEEAAKAGHTRAAFNLAQIITAKRPTWAGFKKALPWYELAAKGGVTDAQYALASIYAEAKGVQFNDDEKALKWLRLAAQGGLDTAQVELGIWLANGRAGPKDPKNAFRWFSRAAVRGNVIAQNRLARMHALGFGTKKNMILAGAWHIVSRRAGFSDSDMDRRFQSLSDIDKKRALETANRLSRL